MSLSRIPRIRVFDGHRFREERSILFDENAILSVGPSTPERNPRERVFEMPDGALALPGFFDSHTHFAQHGLSETLGTYLRDVRDLDHLLQIVLDLSRSPEEDVLILDGVDETSWPDPRLPERADLDRVTSRVPVFVRRVCGHITICNTAAVHRLPETLAVEDPERGFLNTSNLDLRDIFPPDPERIEKGILGSQSLAHSRGITSIYDYGKLRHFEVYRALEDRGSLKVRVHFAFYPDQAGLLFDRADLREIRSPFLRVRGFKLYLDGSVGARTAAFFEPYADAPDTTGVLYRTREEIEARLHQADEAGLQVSLHAIGDRAVDLALLVLRSSRRRVELRHRLEHLEFPTPEAIRLARKLDVALSVQPNFIANWADAGGMYWHRLGESRWRRNNPLGTLHRSGLRMGFGSDSMPMDPILGLRGAMEHPIETERVPIEVALSSYTSQGAYLAAREAELGRIEPGFLPDLTVLNGTPVPGTLDRIRPLAVFSGGTSVFLATETLR